MLTQKVPGSKVHPLQIRGGPQIPADGVLDGQRAQPDPVTVLARACIVAGMEIRANLTDGGYSDGCGQQPVDRGQEPEGICRLFEDQVGHLAAGMDAGVRSAGTRDGNRHPQRGFQRCFDGSLDGGVVWLDLPAVPIRSEVFDIEAIGGHFSGKAYLERDASAR